MFALNLCAEQTTSENTKLLIFQVGLIQAGRPTPLSWVRVTYPPERRDKMAERSMGLCVKPLHNQYNRALWLVEFIQFYNLLGVNQFVLYNHSIGPDVDRVLQYMITHNSANLTITLLPWNLPLPSQKKIRTEAQFTALNDCNFRLINRVKYAVMVVSTDNIVTTNIVKISFRTWMSS